MLSSFAVPPFRAGSLMVFSLYLPILVVPRKSLRKVRKFFEKFCLTTILVILLLQLLFNGNHPIAGLRPRLWTSGETAGTAVVYTLHSRLNGIVRQQICSLQLSDILINADMADTYKPVLDILLVYLTMGDQTFISLTCRLYVPLYKGFRRFGGGATEASVSAHFICRCSLSRSFRGISHLSYGYRAQHTRLSIIMG